ncbi:MAG: c-type cytochrome domain-containing protein, partial [Planctomycetota bacterium]
MHKKSLLRAFSIALLVVFIHHAATADDGELDARSGNAILKQYCYKCHGVDKRYPGLDVTDRATMLQPADENEDPFLIAGKPDESRILEQIESNEMPPEGQPQLSQEEKGIVREWIDAGAVFPKPQRPQREFRGEATILAAIQNDLADLPDDSIPHIRYFSLLHLWNDTQSVDPTKEIDLRLTRAAVSKLINSLSRRSRVVAPRVVADTDDTLLAIDLRDYGWQAWHWRQLLKQYPYGLKSSGRTAANIYRVTGTRAPYLRADWFVAMASRPPLYHDLLGIPKNAKTLEHELGVDIAENFRRGQLQRAAFQKSGVSQQNRMVERHDTDGGARFYWKS